MTVKILNTYLSYAHTHKKRNQNSFLYVFKFKKQMTEKYTSNAQKVNIKIMQTKLQVRKSIKITKVRIRKYTLTL